MELYKVELFVDDGWERFTTKHYVLAETEKRALELAVQWWKDKDYTNIVRPQKCERLPMTEKVFSWD